MVTGQILGVWCPMLPEASLHGGWLKTLSCLAAQSVVRCPLGYSESYVKQAMAFFIGKGKGMGLAWMGGVCATTGASIA